METDFLTTTDGLRLMMRRWGTEQEARLPVLCLPGFSRSGRDFAALAAQLPGRVLVALDARGRGGSDHDPNPANYNPVTEAQDGFAALAALGWGRAVILGTSRGGIVASVMAASNPSPIAGIVLNDIGPVIDKPGLEAILRAFRAAPASWPDWATATAALKHAYQSQFDLDDAGWARHAREIWADGPDACPRREMDPALIEVFAQAVAQTPPDIWNLFDALAPLPVLAVRGANSDLLSAQTLREMQARLPRLHGVTVPGRGHAPFLDEPIALSAIQQFLSALDHA